MQLEFRALVPIRWSSKIYNTELQLLVIRKGMFVFYFS